jgi:sugar/nucleoside kinase (ribokinase family)
MQNAAISSIPIQSTPLDYLVIGHLTADITPNGIKLGGTAAFSALTAARLGLNTGIITACSDDLNITEIDDLWVKRKKSEHSTTFENISDGVNRTQYLYHKAELITKPDVPEFKAMPKIVHLGPVADEVDPDILELFPYSLKCLTPQGWFRGINSEHHVILRAWDGYEKHLAKADIAVISQEDVQKDEEQIAKMALSIPIFVVTENYKGARVYWHNDARFINAPQVKYQDDTGAGDIFATAFFYRYLHTKNPWEAGRFATMLASWSVTRKHLNSIPLSKEISQAKMEFIEN